MVPGQGAFLDGIADGFTECPVDVHAARGGSFGLPASISRMRSKRVEWLVSILFAELAIENPEKKV
jgi:hypothetical protein